MALIRENSMFATTAVLALATLVVTGVEDDPKKTKKEEVYVVNLSGFG